MSVTPIMPVVSIVTPCYNAERYLVAMLDSVAAQSFADWEHIVVDDGSTDRSAGIVERRSRVDSRVRLIRQANSGVAHARKAGYRLACETSRFVYFLDADDLIEPEMLAVMIGYLEAHPSVGVAYCDFITIDEDGREIPHREMPRYVPTSFGFRELRPEEPETPLISIYCWAPVMESVSVLRRSIYDLTEGWDETIGQPGEGVDLFLQMAFHSQIHFVNRTLYRYRRHQSQASFDDERLRRQDLKVQLKWRDRTGLPPRHRALVDQAQAFRAGRLRLGLDVRAGVRYLRRAEMRHAAKCLINAARTASRMLRHESPWPARAAG